MRLLALCLGLPSRGLGVFLQVGATSVARGLLVYLGGLLLRGEASLVKVEGGRNAIIMCRVMQANGSFC